MSVERFQEKLEGHVERGETDEVDWILRKAQRELSVEDWNKLCDWVNAKMADASSEADREAYKKARWRELAGYLDDDQTLRDVWEDIPPRLRRFVEREARRGTERP